MRDTGDKRLVEKELLFAFHEIDVLTVIEQYLLYKGTDHIKRGAVISVKEIEPMVLLVYKLKSNATNKLYAAFHLDKSIHRAGLKSGTEKVRIPNDIFDRVSAIHEEFKKRKSVIDAEEIETSGSGLSPSPPIALFGEVVKSLGYVVELELSRTPDSRNFEDYNLGKWQELLNQSAQFLPVEGK